MWNDTSNTGQVGYCVSDDGLNIWVVTYSNMCSRTGSTTTTGHTTLSASKASEIPSMVFYRDLRYGPNNWVGTSFIFIIIIKYKKRKPVSAVLQLTLLAPLVLLPSGNALPPLEIFYPLEILHPLETFFYQYKCLLQASAIKSAKKSSFPYCILARDVLRALVTTSLEVKSESLPHSRAVETKERERERELVSRTVLATLLYLAKGWELSVQPFDSPQ